MKKRLARSFSRSPIELETSIRQNMTAFEFGTSSGVRWMYRTSIRIDEGNDPPLMVEPFKFRPKRGEGQFRRVTAESISLHGFDFSVNFVEPGL